MKKSFFSLLYILSLGAAGLTIHQAFAGRAPSVEPLTEVSIEENTPDKPHSGFNFTEQQPAAAPALAAKRVPANIATKGPKSTPYSFVGPLIFLLALPIAGWIVISKKMEKGESSEKVDYYPKTFQFKPYKTDYQKMVEDEEDEDLPKAS